MGLAQVGSRGSTKSESLGNGAAGNAWNISGLPTTFVLDRDGRVVRRLTGPQTARGLLGALS